MKLPGVLLAILGVFVILTGVYSVNTPYRTAGILLNQRMPDPVTGQMVSQTALDIGAPDERQHANYITHLKQGQGFPVLKVGDPAAYENYQSHQPPLYYLLATGWSALTGSDPSDPGSAFKLRFLNSLIGAATLLAIYFAGIWGTQRQDLSLAATAFAALLPMNVALHAAVTNDPLSYCLITWFAALVIKGVQQGWDQKLSLILGLLLGLGMLTKTTAIVGIPLAGFALLCYARDSEKWFQTNALRFLTILAVGLGIASFWLFRNKGLYGDFLATSVFNAAFSGSPQAETFITGLGASTYWLNMVLWWTARSFIGAFGYMDIFLFESLGREKSGLLYLAILVLVGGVALFGQIGLKELRAESDRDSLPDPARFQLIHLILLALVTILFIRFNMQYFQGQARYLFPALISFAYLFAAGSVRLTKSRPDLAYFVPVAFLGLLNFAALSTLIQGFPLRITP